MQDGSTLHISDVIEIIETDFDFTDPVPVTNQDAVPISLTTVASNISVMFNGGCEISQGQMAATNSNLVSSVSRQRNSDAYVQIVEQPAPKALRFRYLCEGRSAGSIPGESSTPENKTFPSIRVVGYQGRAVVVVSCVTKDDPYRPHPHNLVGREGCKKGVCTMEIPPETMTATFSNLGIQCVKKRDIENALRMREEIRVDPFRTGFNHKNQPTSIDLNAVRLCFQVFLEGEQKGKLTKALAPVVSEVIFDKKAMSDLIIVKLSDCVSCVGGGTKDIILLCEKVAKEDIQIRFYEEKDGQVVWEGLGDFQPSQVHKQTAIWFRAPKYHTLEVTEPVKVNIQLRRPSDGAASEPLPFELLPLDSEPGVLKRKRHKFDDNSHIFRGVPACSSNAPTYMLNLPSPMNTIKVEPRETSTSPYGGQMYTTGGLSPMYPSANLEMSPQYQAPIDISASLFNNQMGLQHPESTILLPQNWNIPISMTENVPGPSNNMNHHDSTMSGLLDLDSQDSLTQLNTGEIAAVIDTNNISETLNNVSLSDIGQNPNMTDSLTRLANNAIDGMYLPLTTNRL